MNELNLRQVLIVGVSLGIVCALVVWYLERFESNRLFAEMRSYMTNYDEFREYLRGRDSNTD